MYKLAISSAARNDLSDSVIWYNNQKKRLGDDFLYDVFNSLEAIEKNPLLFTLRFSGKFRFNKLKRFPFLIVYEIADDTVIINAVFHTSRNPHRF